ncbi:MAG: hypothetical protein KH369_16420 [Paraclostridium bifermentans]|uniref:hypothetical protein n=1 Tax=Paraclostridium bifermentans TaxID=1490 RepID=UPI001D69D3E8|nr:hypothetical protein [Paraclostridium bifermentans]MBS6509788.1 hypothetical protein [Paraclostridium bifermentans]
MNNTVEIVLQEQIYNGKMDMRCLANVQAEMKKQSIEMSMQDIFNAITKQDLNIVLEIVVQSIQRCHKQIKRASIEDKITFEEMENIFKYIAKLAEVSMPKTEEGKSEEEK